MGFIYGTKSKYSRKCAESLSKNILTRPRSEFGMVAYTTVIGSFARIGNPEKAVRSVLAQCKYCKVRMARTVEAIEAHDEVCTAARPQS